MTYTYFKNLEVGTENLDLQFDMEIYPHVPGKLNGRPENCFPPEEGYAEIDSVYVIDGEGGLVPFDQDRLTSEQIQDICNKAYEKAMSL